MRSTDEIINDSIKATLFGKFYEKIVLGWFKEKEGFIPFEGKPRIYWKDVKSLNRDSEAVSNLNELLKKYKKEKQFCTPDGLLQKEDKFYIWEAKNWPLWSEGKKPLVQLKDLLFSMPLIFATTAIYRTQKYNVHGILFSWWSKPEGVKSLLRKINTLIAPRTFEMFYTDDILEECIQNKYPWYLQIIEGEKERIDGLFRDLLGQS